MPIHKQPRTVTPILTRPKEFHVLASPSAYTVQRKKPQKNKKTINGPMYVVSTTLYIPKTYKTAKLFAPDQERRTKFELYIHRPSNCLLMVRGEIQTPRLKLKIRGASYAVELPSSRVSPISYSVIIQDFVIYENVFIIRWPVLLYANDSISPDDRFRTIDRQRRESELIERTHKPLREDRLKPYPFFVPALPLDPFWTPTTISPVQALKERNARHRAEQNAGERTV